MWCVGDARAIWSSKHGSVSSGLITHKTYTVNYCLAVIYPWNLNSAKGVCLLRTSFLPAWKWVGAEFINRPATRARSMERHTDTADRSRAEQQMIPLQKADKCQNAFEHCLPSNSSCLLSSDSHSCWQFACIFSPDRITFIALSPTRPHPPHPLITNTPSIHFPTQSKIMHCNITSRQVSCKIHIWIQNFQV